MVEIEFVFIFILIIIKAAFLKKEENLNDLSQNFCILKQFKYWLGMLFPLEKRK